MPNRILRDGILTSPKVAKLGWAEEVLYRRLMSLVDDYGRFFADPGLLRGYAYPRQLNKVSDSDIGKWLDSCAATGLVRVYSAKDGERYLEIVNFGQQIRATKSKFPAPTSIAIECNQLLANDPLDVSVSVSVSEGVNVTPAKPDLPTGKKKKTQLPADFGISDRVLTWANEHGFGQLEQHLDAFRRKATAKGYTYVSWDDAFMEAIREDWAKLRQPARGYQATQPTDTVPSKPGIDPALAKVIKDSISGTTPPAAIREQMAKITGARP